MSAMKVVLTVIAMPLAQILLEVLSVVAMKDLVVMVKIAMVSRYYLLCLHYIL